MDIKIKVVLVVLAVITILSLVTVGQLNNTKTIILKEKAGLLDSNKSLEKRNSELNSAISSLRDEKARIQSRIDILQKDLETAAGEKNSLKERQDILAKEKEALLSKIEKMADDLAKKEAEPPKPAVQEDAFWADVLKAKAELEVQLKNIQDGSKDFNSKLEQLSKEKEDLQLQVTKLSKEKEELKGKADYNNELANTLSKDLAKEKLDKKSIDAQLKTFKDENDSLRTDLKEQKQLESAIQNKLEQLQQEKEASLQNSGTRGSAAQESAIQTTSQAQGAISQATSTEGILEKDSVELPTIVVRQQGEPQGVTYGTTKEGKVILVNKENNFIVFNLGEEQGMKLGDSLNVYRANKRIGKVEIIQVRKDVSAADIKELKKGEEIRAEDSVKF